MREIIRRVHGYVGLAAGLLLCLTGLTGSLLVFSAELDRAANPHLWRVPERRERASLQSVLDEVKRRLPPYVPETVRMPVEPGEAYEITLNSPDHRRVYVDPYTGHILGWRSATSYFRGWVFELHRRLLAGHHGENLTGAGGIALAVLCVTGLVLVSWSCGIANTILICWRARAAASVFHWHVATGIAGSVLLIPIALTGAALIFHAGLDRVAVATTGSSLRVSPPPYSRPPGTSAVTAPVDAILETANHALPGGLITFISMPPGAGYVVVRKRLPGEMHPNGRSMVYVDAAALRVVIVEDARRAPWPRRAFNLAYPLHIGQYLGWFGRAMQMAAGFLPTILFVTGWILRGRCRSSRR
ncbi:MAG TPA: PepSY-associated TM helix domain-containing protein [Bryobacteraceae bacterium]|nr:PepSY-associated TM helix domain-containing protein [Bryobacteraceae bacterium]